jgi:hypothetical protein
MEKITSLYIWLTFYKPNYFTSDRRIYTQAHGRNYTCLSASQKGLTFKPGRYLNYSTCFIKINILLEQKKIKLWNERHTVGNKTDFAACLNNAVNFIVV